MWPRTPQGNLYVSRVRRLRPHSEVLARRRISPTMGRHAAKSRGSSAARRAWPSTTRIASGSPTPATTASRSSTREGKLIKHWGAGRLRRRASLYYPYGLRSTARVTCTSASTATTACRNSPLDGKSLGCWGTHGREPGPASQPVGDRVRQPRPAPRARFEQPPRAAIVLGIRMTKYRSERMTESPD